MGAPVTLGKKNGGGGVARRQAGRRGCHIRLPCPIVCRFIITITGTATESVGGQPRGGRSTLASLSARSRVGIAPAGLVAHCDCASPIVAFCGCEPRPMLGLLM